MSVLKKLDETTQEGALIAPSELRASALELETKSDETRRKFSAPFMTTVIPGTLTFMGTGVFGLDVIALSAAGAGVVGYGILVGIRGRAGSKARKSKKALKQAIGTQLAKYSIRLLPGFLDRLTDQAMHLPPGKSTEFVDMEKSLYLLRTSKSGDISILLKHKSSTAELKKSVKGYATQLLGINPAPTPELESAHVLHTLPRDVVKQAERIEKYIANIDVYRVQLGVVELHTLEHIEKELLSTMESYVRLSRMKGSEYGKADTLQILSILEQEAQSLHTDISEQIERDLAIQRAYVESRREAER
jgi:hypothetical protein